MRSRTIPAALKRAVLRAGVRPTRFLLTVSLAHQRMSLFEQDGWLRPESRFPQYLIRRQFVVSTSRFGAGQLMHSNQTPRGLHRIARKVGGGEPVGTIFKAREPVGFTWQGQPGASIVHRILWLEGLEWGLNRGGQVDTFQRYIYIHGYGDESTLGRPRSRGCIHLAAGDLMPLYHRLPLHTLLWIGL